MLSQLWCITVMYVCTVVAARYKLLSYWVSKKGYLSIKTISNPPFSSKCLYQVGNMAFFLPLFRWFGMVLFCHFLWTSHFEFALDFSLVFFRIKRILKHALIYGLIYCLHPDISFIVVTEDTRDVDYYTYRNLSPFSINRTNVCWWKTLNIYEIHIKSYKNISQ